MFSPRTFLPFSAAAMLLGSTAIADVTAADVWADFQESLSVYGDEQISIGSESVDGDTLTVSDIQIEMLDPQADMAVRMTVDAMSFTDQGDGTVLITMSETMPISFTDLEGENGLTASLRTTGLNIVASGTPDELTYDITAATYGITLDSVSDFGETIPIDAAFTMNGVTGTYVIRPGDIRETVYELNGDRLDLFVDFDDPSEQARFNISGQIANFATAGRASAPTDISFDDPENVDLSDIDIEGGYTFGELAYVFDFLDGNDGASGTIQAVGGLLDLTFNYDLVSYETAVQGLQADVMVNGFPFPINIAAAEYGLNFAMPLSQSEEPAPMSIGINITELGINDEIWMLGDPAGQLPHDPVTAQIGISGTVKMLFDLLDQEQQMAMAMAAMPAEPHSVQIDTLNIDALGLQVTGEGAFTFDNTDMQTIPGVPRPEGSVTVNAAGLNGLLDTLVNMGLVPADQIMGARMMMGMFATSTGDDQLTSTLEINSQGHIIANGQRLQ